MTEQAYYRLEELQAMGITEGKLRYLLEQEQVTPAFFMHNERFIIGGYLSNKFVGFAVADYSGLVTIHKQLIPELLTKGKVSVKQVLLMQKERIRVLATEYPFQVKMPNSYIDGWKPNDLTKLVWLAYPALFMPTENTGVLHQLSDMLQSFGSSTGNKVDYSRFVDGMPKTELVVLKTTLSFFDICLPKNISPSFHYRTPNEQHVNKSEKRVREIDEVVLNVLSETPHCKSSSLWSLLKNEVSSKNRLYDLHEVIDEVGMTELIWSDRAGNPQTIQKKSFYNLVKKLRNN